MRMFTRRDADPVTRLMAAARLPTGGGPIPLGDLAMDVLGRNSRRTPQVLAVVEELLAESGDAGQVALTFLEDLQNAASHGTDGLLTSPNLLPLCGPLTLAAWEMIDQFWAKAVVAWCDTNGVDLQPAETLDAAEHPTLRSIMWPVSRTLPDGRRVGLGEVLRYEKATGRSMTGSRPHSQA